MHHSEQRKIAFERRLDVLDMVYNSKAGHIGSSMSAMDILVCLYYEIIDIDKVKKKSPDRDWFILSKGHCAEALYAILADCGFIARGDLRTFASFNTRLTGHPTNSVNGVEFATGSLGHGLSVGVGVAIGLKKTGRRGRVYILMGDGEQAEGSVWEAAMAASKYNLDNLMAIVDRNRLQISGLTEDVMPLKELEGKYSAFGWSVRKCDGHDFESLKQELTHSRQETPTVIIANTIKGYGSEMMENKAEWHHRIPSEREYICIRDEFTRKIEALKS